MKRKLLSLLFIASSFIGWSQSVSITGATAGSSGNVVVGQSTYHASESIYLDAEIGASNFVGAGNGISRVEFAANNTGTAVLPITVPGFSIYMKNVAAGTATFTTGTYALAGYTLVYNGSLSVNSAGAQYSFTFGGGVDLTTPFVRTAGTNLQVLIIRNSGAATTGLVFDCSNGNSTDATGTITTSRRYNGTAALAENSTSLTATNFRPAIKLIRALSNDAAVTAFTSVPSSASCYTSNQTIAVTLSNAGTNAIAASGVPVTLSVTGANTFTSTVSNSASIAVGGSTTITFTGVNLSNAGSNSIAVYSNMTGDGSATNDTVKTTITTTTTRTTFPVVAGAESSPLIFEYLKSLSGSRALWGLNSSLTTSTTGAFKNADLTDSLYPKTGTKYYIFDSYSGASSLGTRVVLYAGCFAFPPTNGTNVYDLKFWMSQDNSLSTDLDSVYAVVSTDKGVTWTRIEPGFARVNAAFTTPGWTQRTVNLTAYAGQTVQVGIEGVSKYGNVIGIDDIVVRANNPLPISLTNFTGTKTGDKNSLKWTTSSEINNAGFDLERSVDGIRFSSIATIESKAVNGNSNSSLIYEYLDAKPFAGTNYYRLKQSDKDGKVSYSQIVVLKSAKVGTITIAAIYPNPAKDKLNITIASGSTEKATLAIYDATGRLVLQKALTLVAGEISLSENIEKLKAGSYLVKVTDEKGYAMDIKTLIKQ